MQSVELLQRKNLEYKQKIDELNDLSAQLKEQLAAKEVIEYEQEMRIRELKNQLKAFGDLEDKLCLANRNARVLEEENNSLLIQLKSAGGGVSGRTADTRVEALSLINENRQLQSDIEYLRETLDKAHQREQQLDQKCKGYIKEQENADTQILILKKQNNELEEQLRELENQWSLSKEAWEAERGHYIQDYDELLASVQRFDNVAQHRDSRDVKERGSDNHIQHAFLKEDIAELEEKMRVMEKNFQTKEREWRQVEFALREEINFLKGKKETGGNEMYRAFQDQLDLFKEEVSAFRGEQRLGRSTRNFPVERGISCASDDEQSTVFELEIKSKIARIETLEEISETLDKKNKMLNKENEKLREEIEKLRDQCARLEERTSEREVRIKELEVLVATGQRNGGLSNATEFNLGENCEKYTDAEKKNMIKGSNALFTGANANLSRGVELKPFDMHKPAASAARESNRSIRTDGVLPPNNGYRVAVSTRNSAKNSDPGLLHDNEDFMLENEQFVRKRGVMDTALFDKFAKERMDYIEDFMRTLETSWTNEEEAKRKLRKAVHQNAELISVIENSGEYYSRNKDLRSGNQQSNGLDAQSQRDFQLSQNEKDEIKLQVNGLQLDNKVKDDKIQKLQDKLDLLEKEVKENSQSMRRNADLSGGSDSGTRRKKFDASTADAGLNQDELSKSKDRRIQELNNQLVTMREANDGLWKQLVDLQSGAKESSGRALSRPNSRSPRRNARRHSLEHLVYSQSSTHLSEERRRKAIADGAHLAVTVVELSDVLRNGKPITEPGYVIIKVKSVKEKYKTSVKELASVVRFDETFVFYLAQPDEDIITLHVFYKPKNSSREYHVGDACFSMASLYRGVPRQRIAIVAQNPGTKDARRSAFVEVIMQSDDFGKMMIPTEAELEDEKLRFSELMKRIEITMPENLHRADVLMSTNDEL